MQQEEGQTPNLVKSKVRSKAAHFQLCLDDASVMGDDTCPPAPGGASSKSIGISEFLIHRRHAGTNAMFFSPRREQSSQLVTTSRSQLALQCTAQLILPPVVRDDGGRRR